MTGGGSVEIGVITAKKAQHILRQHPEWAISSIICTSGLSSHMRHFKNIHSITASKTI
jgi:hypothetical protein